MMTPGVNRALAGTQTDLRLTLMKALTEKVEKMVNGFYEVMDTDQTAVEGASRMQDDEAAGDFELNREANHTLIELCW
jgi:hypothetical protein